MSIWIKILVGGRVLQSFLLVLFFTSEPLMPSSDLSSWKRTQLMKLVQIPFNLGTGDSPACWVKLLQTRSCCAVAGVVERGKLNSAGLPWPSESLGLGSGRLCLILFSLEKTRIDFGLDTPCAIESVRKSPAKLHWRPEGKKVIINQLVRFAARWWSLKGGHMWQRRHGLVMLQSPSLWGALACHTSSRRWGWPVTGDGQWPINRISWQLAGISNLSLERRHLEGSLFLNQVPLSHFQKWEAHKDAASAVLEPALCSPCKCFLSENSTMPKIFLQTQPLFKWKFASFSEASWFLNSIEKCTPKTKDRQV